MKVDSLHILICQLKMKHVIFVTNGESLSVNAPKGVIDSELRTYLRTNKPAIIKALQNETLIREWLARVSDEVSFVLNLPDEVSRELEDRIVDFIDGQIAFDQLEMLWRQFVERYRSERAYEDETL